jgi:hypothetical protein
MPDTNAVRKLLIEARERIADPAHWTQNAFARNALGEETDAGSPHAESWCAKGSLMRSIMTYGCTVYVQASEALERAVSGWGHCGRDAVFNMNDTSTHAEVVAAFDRAIAPYNQEE